MLKLKELGSRPNIIGGASQWYVRGGRRRWRGAARHLWLQRYLDQQRRLRLHFQLCPSAWVPSSAYLTFVLAFLVHAEAATAANGASRPSLQVLTNATTFAISAHAAHTMVDAQPSAVALPTQVFRAPVLAMIVMRRARELGASHRAGVVAGGHNKGFESAASRKSSQLGTR